MQKVAIVTDTGAAIAPEMVARLLDLGGFALVDMPVTIAGSAVPSQQADEEIVVAHALGELVQTSSPSPGAFLEAYTLLAEQGFEAIISLHLPAELSGTYNAAKVAAAESPVPVTVLDSRTIAMAYGHVALKAHELALAGHDAATIAAVVLEMCENTEIFFVIPTLDALRRGGRVHPAVARVGQLLQIRPVGTVIDGKLTYLERPRTLPRALELLVDFTREDSDRRALGIAEMEQELTPRPSGQIVAAHFCGKEAECRELLSSFGVERTAQTQVAPLPAVLSAHTGVGALAFVIY